MKVKDQIRRIQRAAAKANRWGRLYSAKADLELQPTQIRLFTLFKSSDGDWLVRAHVFKSRAPLSDEQWHAKLSTLLTDDDHSAQLNVLAGITTRTGDSAFWSVARYIGWVPDAVHKSKNAGKRRSRSKSAKKGSKVG